MKTDFSLKNKTILLTGASGNIGKALAQGLCHAGATVICCGVTPSKLRLLEKQLSRAGYSYEIMILDIMNDVEVDKTVNYISKKYQKLDGIVNNAYSGSGESLEMLSREAIEKSFNMNVISPLLLIKKLLPLLEKAESSSIVNMASMYGMVSPDPSIYGDSGCNNPSFYGAGKAGLIQLTKYLACHLPDKGIRVNSVSPGPFPPQEIIKKHPDFYQKLINKVPLKRIGDPNELIGIVQFLLSDSSSYITGANIPVDGGWTAW